MKEYLTPTELAELWGISENTLRKWRWEGKGPRYVKLGERVVYRRNDIDAYASANIYTSTSDNGAGYVQ
ncbi:MAG: DNA-binding protein [Proteobacteria bacterium]|nr:DNA-binding protein [Pseudomonadota bacterium]